MAMVSKAPMPRNAVALQASSKLGPKEAWGTMATLPTPESRYASNRDISKSECSQAILDFTDTNSKGYQEWLFRTMDELDNRQRWISARRKDKQLVSAMKDLVSSYSKPSLKARQEAAERKSVRALLRRKAKDMRETTDPTNQQARSDYIWRYEAELKKQEPSIRTTLRIDDSIPVEAHLRPGTKNDYSAVDALGNTSAFLDAITRYHHAASEARDKWDAKVEDSMVAMRKAVLENEDPVRQVQKKEIDRRNRKAQKLLEEEEEERALREKEMDEQREARERPLALSLEKFDRWIAHRVEPIPEIIRRSKSVPGQINPGRPGTAPT
eukprot:TRINITY_DN97436_c0_g1_i1.p1 TRINITY_DN97436_c0_g1~~TRINITY_DN97436_c0_g1_i1.p1  ORF type:complete len:326 (-),score=56.02 TRINITY_DN97436_c0_g1_i1:56-1033(-)